MTRLLRILSVVACLALPLAFGSTAHASSRSGDPDYTAVPPATAPATTAAPTVVGPSEEAAPPAANPNRLAVTGSDVLQTGMIGIALVAVGGVVVLATRRRTA